MDTAGWGWSQRDRGGGVYFTQSTQLALILCFCVRVCVRHLCRVNVVEHDNGGAVVVEHQAPEVLDCVGQRMLGNDEGRRLLVALQHDSRWRRLHF